MNTQEIQEKYPEAFEALPEPYREDDCLRFYEASGILYCQPETNQPLGEWVCVFTSSKRWTQIA